jgi:hypothetical protein
LLAIQVKTDSRHIDHQPLTGAFLNGIGEGFRGPFTSQTNHTNFVFSQ